MRKSVTVLGIVLVLLGFYALATIASLVRAYMAKSPLHRTEGS